MSMSKRETAEDYRLQRKQQGRQTEQAILQAALELARDKAEQTLARIHLGEPAPAAAEKADKNE